MTGCLRSCSRTAEAALPVDGVLLELHGAMVTEELEDAEGDIISHVREVVGPEVPVIATLDLHANISPLMVEESDALIGYDTYPHVDAYERGRDAVRLMLATDRAGRAAAGLGAGAGADVDRPAPAVHAGAADERDHRARA
jgi:microcystin degradation protein MlrC